MANEVIRETAKASGVKFWEIAEFCGIADSTFTRHLRRELPEEKKQRVLEAIKQIAANKAEVNKCQQ